MRTIVASSRQPKSGGEDDRRRVDRDAGREAALQEEERRAQQPGLRVEAAPEVLVGRVDVEPPVDRQEDRGDQDQGEGRAEVVLHEAQPVLVALARRGEERDRARLRRHDREADRRPSPSCRRPSGRRCRLLPVARPPDAVGGDADQGAEQDDVVERIHENSQRQGRQQRRPRRRKTPATREVDRPPGAEPGQAGRARLPSGFIFPGRPGWRRSGRRRGRRRAAAGTRKTRCRRNSPGRSAPPAGRRDCGASPGSLAGEERREARRPTALGKYRAALLHPAVEVRRGDPVGRR